MITLTSTLPQKGSIDNNDKNGILQVGKTAKGWGSPQFIDFDMGYEGGFGYPTTANDKTMYFAYIPTDGTRNMDIFRSTYVNGQYQSPTKLPGHINSDQFEGDPYIDPQERFLIFA
jgi:hypothetical protein